MNAGVAYEFNQLSILCLGKTDEKVKIASRWHAI
jgi:hypothetical protein